MKKYLLSWMTILMVAIVSVSFVSCGDDDDDKKTGSSVSIIGTWRHDFGSDGGYIIMQFNEDNTGYSQEYDPNDGGLRRKHNFTYQYDITMKRIYIRDSDGDQGTYEVRELTNTTLVLYDLNESGDKALEKYVRIL